MDGSPTATCEAHEGAEDARLTFWGDSAACGAQPTLPAVARAHKAKDANRPEVAKAASGLRKSECWVIFEGPFLRLHGCAPLRMG